MAHRQKVWCTYHMSIRQRGYTIPELLIVMFVLSTMSAILFVTLDAFFYDNLRTLGSTLQVNETRTVLRQMQSNVSEARNFLTVNTVQDPTGPPGGGAWSYTGPAPGTDSTKRYLIVSTYATTAAVSDPARSLVYTPGVSGVCNTTDPTNNAILENNYVYFVHNQTLYRRTIVNDPATGRTVCGSAPFQKQSCAPGYTNSRCQATDAVLLRNVKAFTVDYYATSASNTPVPNIFTTPALLDENISTAVITVTTTHKINGKDNDYTASIRISKAQ